ncbi:hypothetical protein NADFUDRAFT_45442 [Nadsonia fulvescens var. elongata DSM 6958]|uniref:Gfd2/YDR514C-like C-terminal domain-containing protein n=1 Tax=Nadsonia fulvescens var. elongata DSM 6958 TaxID=857566 RepID=A0A1E3PQV6_9ASCO|nr:hypothetical protein NADFUDRAFT_45442 [Nadsonia fulvescens var. elongata DSM 6958]
MLALRQTVRSKNITNTLIESAQLQLKPPFQNACHRCFSSVESTSNEKEPEAKTSKIRSVLIPRSKNETVEDKVRPRKPTFNSGDRTYATLNQGIDWVTSRSKVFISFDLEHYEFEPTLLTEIGITVYDPYDKKWDQKNQPVFFPRFRSSHIIVDEHKRHRNGRFVPDNMFNFLFGKSNVMKQKAALKAFTEIINHYNQAYPGEVVFIGQQLSGDILFLKKMGIQVPENIPILDTERVWKESQPEGSSNLAHILQKLDLPHSFIHNAGNDSYYTLMALFSLCDLPTRKCYKLDEPLTIEITTQSKPLSKTKRKHLKAFIPRFEKQDTPEDALLKFFK